MVCTVDIEKHNSWVQQDRVYKFLAGLDDRLDSTRADIIQTVPLPTVEQAYARIRREEMRQKVMCGNDSTFNPAVMAMKDADRAGQHTDHTPKVSLSLKSETKQGKGCTHCHNPRHTKETCFQLHGYPDWWKELKEKKTAGNKKGQGGQVHLAGCTNCAHGYTETSTGQASLTLATHVEGTERSAEKGNALITQNLEKWVIDSGATDHMTYLDSDLDKIEKSNRKEIVNANGVPSPVIGSGTVNMTQSLYLKDTLLVPSLTTKLISVGRLAEDLNCAVLMYPNFCIF